MNEIRQYRDISSRRQRLALLLSEHHGRWLSAEDVCDLVRLTGYSERHIRRMRAELLANPGDQLITKRGRRRGRRIVSAQVKQCTDQVLAEYDRERAQRPVRQLARSIQNELVEGGARAIPSLRTLERIVSESAVFNRKALKARQELPTDKPHVRAAPPAKRQYRVYSPPNYPDLPDWMLLVKAYQDMIKKRK